jgi:CheY-like chemotaxis protein
MHYEVQPPPSSRPNRVLVVDDSDDAAWALASLLQWCGHEVHVAHTGQRAIELAERLRPAVIFLDLAMPGMDGFETAMRIRRRRWGREIVLCALSAFDTPEFRERSDEVSRWPRRPEKRRGEPGVLSGNRCKPKCYSRTRHRHRAQRLRAQRCSLRVSLRC